MRKIKTDFQLLLALASYHVGLISTKVIDQLMLLKNGFLLSGDDSGLKNTWEEICIQVQGEESIHWDVYSDAIRNFITDELTKQTESIQILLSYIGGIESDIRIEEDEDCYAFIQEYAVKEILENIL